MNWPVLASRAILSVGIARCDRESGTIQSARAISFCATSDEERSDDIRSPDRWSFWLHAADHGESQRVATMGWQCVAHREYVSSTGALHRQDEIHHGCGAHPRV